MKNRRRKGNIKSNLDEVTQLAWTLAEKRLFTEGCHGGNGEWKKMKRTENIPGRT